MSGQMSQLGFFEAPKPEPAKAAPQARYYQHDALRAIHASLQTNRSSLLVMATGLGKQQPVSEPVLTPSGWKVMGDLRVGDMVIGSSGEPIRVTGVFPQGVRPVYRIKLNDGSFSRCGDEHLWSVRTKTDKHKGRPFRALTTAQIAGSLHMQWQIPSLSPVTFGADESAESLIIDPYELGVILGDGCIAHGYTACTDTEIGESIGWRETKKHETSSYTSYFAIPRSTSRALAMFGLRWCRSWEKFVPGGYMNASIRARVALLNGLMDTDGFPGGTGGAEFSSTSLALVNAVVDLVRSLGGVARGRRVASSSYTYMGEKRNGRTAWRVNLKLPAGIPMFRLQRKAAIYREPTKYHPTRVIRDVVSEGVSEEQVCISVDAADKLYVTRDYILTHNTFTFGKLIHDWPGRCLVVAHRNELIEQGRDAIRRITGESVGTEKAQQYAGKERIVVASIQTLAARMDRFKRDEFSLVVIDEAHRTPAPSYVKMLEYFSSAKVLGVTATPDCSDEKAMGRVFDDVAFVMDIEDGIDAGYLVPVRGETFMLGELDLSRVNVSGGDFVQGELDEAMLGVVESVVDQTLAHSADKQAIVFTPGVRSAHAMCERANLTRPGSSIAIDGKTDPMVRRHMVADFKAGKIQYLWNCAVATEGFDAPATAVVAVARPTESRGLYAQMAGRGTRVLPGVVDHLHGRENAAARKAAIAASAKPFMTLFDFSANAGKHTLVTPMDVLGGNYTDAEVKQAKKRQEKNPGEDLGTSLKVARVELVALARKLAEAQLKVKARKEPFDPFRAIGVERGDAVTVRFGGRPATEAQVAALIKLGLPKGAVEGVNFRQAARLMQKVIERREKGYASLKQLAVISKYAAVPDELPYAAAQRMMNYIVMECGYGRRKPVIPGVIAKMMEGAGK